MRIIGIDPGIEKTGFAIIEKNAGRLQLLDFGLISTSKKLPTAHRLTEIAHDLKSILKQWKPEAAAIEQVFFSKNVKTAITVAHARGVLLELLQEHGIPVMELNPSQIKVSVCGDGRADKLQLKKMIRLTFGLEVKNDDTADAIACSLTACSIPMEHIS